MVIRCSTQGAWPGRGARCPTPSEAPPDLGPFLRFLIILWVAAARAGRAVPPRGPRRRSECREGGRVRRCDLVARKEASVQSRERACARGPDRRLGRAAALAAPVAPAAECPPELPAVVEAFLGPAALWIFQPPFMVGGA
ncbi:hypothetical protein NDU88_001604 [Pleurodeles waltl]|uniref:Uncharacterized protein n=1 Tax=Pleurodeles waltl TaxID=8319 RepID=A0AAV7Q6H0_PLEWA|nr:hypothetical protein NDU88_001604 [Pleurodeles waltl]